MLDGDHYSNIVKHEGIRGFPTIRLYSGVSLSNHIPITSFFALATSLDRCPLPLLPTSSPSRELTMSREGW